MFIVTSSQSDSRSKRGSEAPRRRYLLAQAVPDCQSGSGRAATPPARTCLEQARDRSGASIAAAFPGKPPGRDVIPISADNPLTAARAVCALAHLVMHI